MADNVIRCFQGVAGVEINHHVRIILTKTSSYKI